jgi:hypothetical protein
MRAVPTLIALALVPYLAGNAGAAVMAGKGAKKEKHPVHGQVVAVQMDGNKTSGTITVLVHHHKKSATAAAPVEKTFKVSASTKFEIVKGKKGAVAQQATDVNAVQKGQHIFLFHNGDEATDVKIVKKGKGKNKNT